MILLAHTSPGLVITVTTDEQTYYPGKPVQILVNLTLDGTPVTDGLVGLQIQDPKNELFIIRTLTTGITPPTTPYIGVRFLIPCNSSGKPKESFRIGTLAYFNMTVTNYDIESRDVLMTVSTYYSNNTTQIPFGLASVKAKISGHTTSSFIVSIPIPEDAPLGNASAYGNAYTDWPQIGGTPYCVERTATFEITNSNTGASQTTQNDFIPLQADETGDYNITFTLPKNAKPGNYAVYTTSRYLGEETFNSTTLKILVLGDIDRDGDIDFLDLYLFRQAYVYGYDPDADLDFNGVIDYRDLYIFRQNYITYA